MLKENWGFRLPTATAILTVLYPEEFTIYDVRVRHQLNQTVYESKDFEKLWKSYVGFIECLRHATPEGLSLRDKDRYLWGKDFAQQLKADMERWDNPHATAAGNTASTRGRKK